MVSVEVRNSTPTTVAYETTSSANLAPSATRGVLIPETSDPAQEAEDTSYYREGWIHDYADNDTSRYYNETEATPWFKKRKKARDYQQSWRDVIQVSGATDTSEPDFDTGEIEAIKNLADKVNSGELYDTDAVIEELGERALALVPLVDVELPLAPVENSLLRVVAINPDFKDDAEAAISKLYSNRPGVSPRLEKVIQETVRRTAQVAANPDDFIDLEKVDEPVPQVDRILEEASNLATARYINQSVMEKEWAAEAEQEKAAS